MTRRKAILSKSLLTACALAMAAVFTGCPKKPKVITQRIPGMAKDSKLGVQVHISEQANGGNPVALDILLVSDKDLLKELQKMTASDWFARRDQIILDHPKERLVARQWEWTPGDLIPPDQIIVTSEIKAGIVFAHYFNPGEHRAVIDPRARGITIELGNDKLKIVTQKK
jgi:hypothetical protein